MTCNILIVDDEALVSKSLLRVFRKDGYNAIVADSGAKALEMLETTPIDLILTDQLMPEMTGVELLTVVSERWPKIKRIILSGYADEQDIELAFKDGIVSCYINKPWDDDELRDVIKEALEE
jgi:CheY-like chemotaxis protein